MDLESQRKMPLFYIDFLFRVSLSTKNEFYNHLAYSNLESCIQRCKNIDYPLANLIMKWENLKMVNLSLTSFFNKHDLQASKIDFSKIKNPFNLSLIVDYISLRRKKGIEIWDTSNLLKIFIESLNIDQDSISNNGYASTSFLFKRNLLKKKHLGIRDLDINIEQSHNVLDFCVNVNKILFKYDLDEWWMVIKEISKNVSQNNLRLIYLDYIKNVLNIFNNKPIYCDISSPIKEFQNLDFFSKIMLSNYLTMERFREKQSFELFT